MRYNLTLAETRMIPTLTKTDLERPRTQEELREWVDDLLRRLSQTSEGIHAVRLNRGKFVKQFEEEIYPLALFADAFFRGRSDVLFQPVIGIQPYDALLVEASTHHYLEITQAFDGHQNHLRMLHIEKHGRAPITGPKLEKDKTRGCVQETWPEAEAHEELLARTFAAIQTAVKEKSVKPNKSDTTLIVEIVDHHIHSESDRRALDSFARSTLVPAAARFAALSLVSDRERLAFNYKTRATTYSRLERPQLDRK
jgi:hypothetical protein